tara:strand:+ start:522 stop:935 length:414 start_codon:yes stop_codon:yes gene_type:complete
MVTFRNNNTRRNSFRRNDRNFKVGSDRNKYNNFSNNDSFQRKLLGRNNQNASKLVEKYNNLAREALSTGDKILSENYFQHADHFTRVLSDREIQKKSLDNKLIKDVDQNLSKNDEKRTENFSQDKNEINNKIATKVV